MDGVPQQRQSQSKGNKKQQDSQVSNILDVFSSTESGKQTLEFLANINAIQALAQTMQEIGNNPMLRATLGPMFPGLMQGFRQQIGTSMRNIFGSANYDYGNQTQGAWGNIAEGSSKAKQAVANRLDQLSRTGVEEGNPDRTNVPIPKPWETPAGAQAVFQNMPYWSLIGSPVQTPWGEQTIGGLYGTQATKTPYTQEAVDKLTLDQANWEQANPKKGGY
jgi:hypothetical protein